MSKIGLSWPLRIGTLERRWAVSGALIILSGSLGASILVLACFRKLFAEPNIRAAVLAATVLIGASLGVLLVGWALSRRRTPSWLISIHRAHRGWPWIASGAFVISSAAIGGSILAVAIFMLSIGQAQHAPGLLTSPGIPAAILAGIATVMTYFTTLIIRTQQEAQIPTIGRLLDEVTAVLKSQLKQVCAADPEDQDGRIEFYMMDYAPAIGIVSFPAQYRRFRNVLIEAARHHMVDMHLLFSSESALTEFYNGMADATGDHLKETNGLIRSLSDEQPVWRSGDIGQMHIIIVGDVAFQYVVLPEDSRKSKAVGLKIEDAFQVEYLKEVIRHSLGAAIKPDLARQQNGDLTLTFPFVPTCCQLALELSEGRVFSASGETIALDGSCTCTISSDTISAKNFLRVRAAYAAREWHADGGAANAPPQAYGMVLQIPAIPS